MATKRYLTIKTVISSNQYAVDKYFDQLAVVIQPSTAITGWRSYVGLIVAVFPFKTRTEETECLSFLIDYDRNFETFIGAINRSCHFKNQITMLE